MRAAKFWKMRKADFRSNFSYFLIQSSVFVHIFYSAIKPAASGYRNFRQGLATNFVNEPRENTATLLFILGWVVSEVSGPRRESVQFHHDSIPKYHHDYETYTEVAGLEGIWHS